MSHTWNFLNGFTLSRGNQPMLACLAFLFAWLAVTLGVPIVIQAIHGMRLDRKLR